MSKIRSLIFKMFKLDSKLSFFEAIDKKNDIRKKRKIKKFYSLNDFKRLLLSLGIKSNDTLIIQCSFRKMMDFKVSPLEICNLLIEVLGKEGNILMPSYTNNSFNFNFFDKSEAGILSETFRRIEGVKRSTNSQFSMTCFGTNSDYLIGEHQKSMYPFDAFSPYYRAVNEKKAKILLIGDTVKTSKLSLVHLFANSIDPHYYQKWQLRTNTIINSNGNIVKNESYHRTKKNSRKAFSKVSIIGSKNASKTIKFGNLDLTIIESEKFANNIKHIKMCLYK